MEYNKGIQKEREAFELAKYMAKHARIDIEECDIDAITIIHRAYNRFCSSNKKKQLKSIDGKTLNKYLDEFLLDLMTEIAHFPKDCPEYTTVYNKYMDRAKIYKEIYEGVDFKGGHIVFHDIHTLTIIQEELNGESKEEELEVGAIYIGKYDELRLIDTDFDFWEVEEYLTDQSLKRLLEIVLNCV